MIKNLVVFFLAFSIAGNCFMPLIMYSGYQVNKAYITSTFCINKNHPELHCDGKCFLSRKLKELDQKTKNNQENLKKSVDGFIAFNVISVQKDFFTFVKETTVGYLEKPTIGLTISIFHPPQVA